MYVSIFIIAFPLCKVKKLVDKIINGTKGGALMWQKSLISFTSNCSLKTLNLKNNCGQFKSGRETPFLALL